MDKSNVRAMKQLNSMVMITILTQIFMLIQNALIASRFGVGIELDAFNFSNNITNFVYSFIGAGISTVIIPFLKERSNKKSLNIFITFIYTVSIAIFIFMLLFRNQIITLGSGSSNPAFLEIASNIFIYTLIAGLLKSLIRFFNAVLEFNGKFNRQKLILLFTTILVVITLFVDKNISIFGYALLLLMSTTISFIAHFLFFKKTDFQYKVDYDLTNNDFRKMLKLYIPTVMSTGVYQISLLIDTMISARLDVGSISILNYANAVISMINMLLLANLTSFMYPRLVKKNNEIERQKSLTQYILFINTLMCLIFILFFHVGQEGISILFERGEFTSENTYIVFISALILAASLPSNGIRDLLYRYFYTRKDTYTPFINSIYISLINVVLSIIFANIMGLTGVILGTVISSYISLFLISIKFRKKFSIYFSGKELLTENLKIVIVTLITIPISFGMKNLLIIENLYMAVIAYSFLIILIFIILLKVLKSSVFKIKL